MKGQQFFNLILQLISALLLTSCHMWTHYAVENRTKDVCTVSCDGNSWSLKPGEKIWCGKGWSPYGKWDDPYGKGDEVVVSNASGYRMTLDHNEAQANSKVKSWRYFHTLWLIEHRYYTLIIQSDINGKFIKKEGKPRSYIRFDELVRQ